jgi:two-component system, sensor histidine kinase and response regulator
MTENSRIDHEVEASRLHAVRSWGVLDMDEDETLQEIAKIAALACGVPVGLIGFMGEDSQVFKARHGWDIPSMPRSLSFCERAIQQLATVLIADAREHPRFASHPLVSGQPHIRFYAGTPLITAEGHVLGTLAIFDSEPHPISATQKRILEALAREVISTLVVKRNMSELERRARETSDVKSALAETEERLHDLFEAVDDYILTIGIDGRLLHVNRAFFDSFEYEREEINRVSVFDIAHSEMRPEFIKTFRRVVATGKPEVIETIFITNHGRRITVEGKLSPRVMEGRTSLVRVIFRDISERKQFEVELGKARDAALESARMKTQFLTNISHEIRTPMNAVVGMLQLLLDSKLDDEQREFARTALSSADELLSIINNILQISKLESGRLRAVLSDFDLLNTVRWIVDVMSVMALEKGLEMTCHMDPRLPPVVYGDVSAVRQILTNLLNNAVKFTEHGEIRLDVELDRETDSHEIVKFTVTDTGMGIPESHLSSIFDSFTQVDGSMTRQHGGVGLGLATAKQLVELLSGVIGVESRVLEGSTFWFSIPFEKRTVTAERIDFTGTRVLVLDQSESSRRIIVHYLESTLNMRCELVEAPEEALERMRSEASLGDPFRVAFFDLHMPSIHGLALAQEIRATPSIATTSLITMTSLGEQVDDDLLREVGIGAWLTKPVEQNELLDVLTIVMAREMRAASTSADASGVVLERRGTALHTHPPVVEPPPAPVVPMRPPAPAAEAPAERPLAAPDGSRRILLAEDNQLNQKLTRSQLVKLGYDVDIVANGREALDALERRFYAVILMDCQMPQMDGYEASMKIRQREKGESRRKIVALTAHALEGDREKCLAAGMDDYLAKPTRQEDLAVVIKRWMP